MENKTKYLKYIGSGIAVVIALFLFATTLANGNSNTASDSLQAAKTLQTEAARYKALSDRKAYKANLMSMKASLDNLINNFDDSTGFLPSFTATQQQNSTNNIVNQCANFQ